VARAFICELQALMQKKLFSELGLSPEILKAVEKMGFEEASVIQSEAIPPLLTGADVVGQSQTGSGKTAAFAIPAIERVDGTLRAPQVLILCPTREPRRAGR
jgi:ATP-dependent RNA helicase DeaD